MKRILFLLLCLVTFLAHRHATRLRRSAGLVRPLAARELAATAVLGGFRGFAAAGLWVRSETLLARRNRESLYALPALYDQLALVQPQMVEMWTYAGRRLAFDAASQFQDPRAQWPWIRMGIEWMWQGVDRLDPDWGERLQAELAARREGGGGPDGFSFFGSSVPVSDVYAHRLHSEIGDILIRRGEARPPAGPLWREEARRAWGVGLFPLAEAHLRRVGDFPDALPAHAQRWGHVYWYWATVETSPERIERRLRKGLEVWERIQARWPIPEGFARYDQVARFRIYLRAVMLEREGLVAAASGDRDRAILLRRASMEEWLQVLRTWVEDKLATKGLWRWKPPPEGVSDAWLSPALRELAEAYREADVPWRFMDSWADCEERTVRWRMLRDGDGTPGAVESARRDALLRWGRFYHDLAWYVVMEDWILREVAALAAPRSIGEDLPEEFVGDLLGCLVLSGRWDALAGRDGPERDETARGAAGHWRALREAWGDRVDLGAWVDAELARLGVGAD